MGIPSVQPVRAGVGDGIATHQILPEGTRWLLGLMAPYACVPLRRCAMYSVCSYFHTYVPPAARRMLEHSEGLLSTQRDEFSIAGWDILLHAVFPGHPFGAEAAPPVQQVEA